MFAKLNRLLRSQIGRRVSALRMGRKAASLASTPPLLFVFHGGNKPWPGMGRYFYRREPAFRESVRRCGRVVANCSGLNIFDFFTADALPAGGDLKETERRNIILISVFELALSDLWRARGVEPGAVAGICSGEIGAAYVAGALTLEES